MSAVFTLAAGRPRDCHLLLWQAEVAATISDRSVAIAATTISVSLRLRVRSASTAPSPLALRRATVLPRRDGCGPEGSRGRTLTRDQQRSVFRRWPRSSCPSGRVPGRDTRPAARSIQPRDPVSALLRHRTLKSGRVARQSAKSSPTRPRQLGRITRCLAHRDRQSTATPHVIVTKGTRAGHSPVPTVYLSHVLDDCGYSPRRSAAPA